MPDAPIGSYIGSEGLPVATGETKIGISEWPESQLEEGGSYLTAVALDNDGLTMAAPLLDGADYAIVPIMAQVEYPANGSTLDLVLPDSVTLLDYYGAPAEDAESLLHNEYSEISAAVLGVYAFGIPSEWALYNSAGLQAAADQGISEGIAPGHGAVHRHRRR